MPKLENENMRTITVEKCDEECPLNYDGYYCTGALTTHPVGGAAKLDEADMGSWKDDEPFPERCPLKIGVVVIKRETENTD